MTLTPIAQVWRRQLRALELTFDLGECYSSLEAPQALAAIHRRSLEDSAFRERVQAYGRSQSKMLLTYLDTEAGADRDFSEEVFSGLFYSLLVGMSTDFSRGEIPKAHHWLPYTYIRRFGARNKSKNNRGATIHEHNFGLTPMGAHRTLTDRAFIHPKRENGQGYYDLPMEAFFSHVETVGASYYDLLERQKTTLSSSSFLVTQAIFFLTQSIRNPRPELGFVGQDVESLVTALMEVAGLTPGYRLAAARSERPQAITPYVPTRVRRTTDGATVFYFPIAARIALLMSDEPVGDPARVVNASAKALVRHAKLRGATIFGLPENAIGGWLR